MDELIDSTYQITLLKDSSYQTEFESATKGPHKNAWETKFDDKSLSLQSDPKVMMSNVMSGQFVMYDSYSAITTLKEFQNCEITDIGFSMSKIDFAFALPKNSPFKEPFNRALRKMLESGEITRIRNRNTNKSPDCEDTGKGKPIGMENVIFPAGIFIIGALGAPLMFIVEQAVHHCPFSI